MLASPTFADLLRPPDRFRAPVSTCLRSAASFPRLQAGASSGYCGNPSSSFSQTCLLEVQTCSVGSNTSGISRLPQVKPMTPALARSEKSDVPQSWQKPRTISGEELVRPSFPLIVTESKGIRTRALNAEPSDRWHSLQWQTRTLMGSPCATYREAPQRHPPRISLFKKHLPSGYTSFSPRDKRHAAPLANAPHHGLKYGPASLLAQQIVSTDPGSSP